MMAIPPRLVVLLVENNPAEARLLQNAIAELELGERLVCLPDGQRALAYLLGRGKFGDRSAWPLAGVVLLNRTLFGLSGFDVLRWIRSESSLANIPVVLLGESFSHLERKRAERLKAACCTKAGAPAELGDRLEHGVTAAQNLVRRAWFNSRAAYGVPEFPAIGETPAIRVWT